MRVTVSHLREVGYCSSGARVMCARLGLEWAEIVQEGIDIQHLEVIDDAMVQALVTHVRDKVSE